MLQPEGGDAAGKAHREAVGKGHDGIVALGSDVGQRGLQLGFGRDGAIVQRQAELSSGCLRCRQFQPLAGVLRVDDQCHAPGFRQELADQCQSLDHQRQREQADAGHAASRVGKAVDQSSLDRIAADAEDDRQRDAGPHQRTQCQTARSHHQVGLRAQDLGQPLGHLIGRALAPPGIDQQVDTLAIAQVAQAAAQRHQIGRRRGCPLGGDPGHAIGPCRLGRGRPGQRCGPGGHALLEGSALHPTTSSARHRHGSPITPGPWAAVRASRQPVVRLWASRVPLATGRHRPWGRCPVAAAPAGDAVAATGPGCAPDVSPETGFAPSVLGCNKSLARLMPR